MKPIITIVFLFINTFLVIGQKHSFGPNLGLYSFYRTGYAICDNILVKVNPEVGRNYPLMGIFWEYNFTENIYLRSELNVYDHVLGAIISNPNDPWVASKAKSIGDKTWELPVLINIRLPLTFSRFSLLAGIDFNYNYYSVGYEPLPDGWDVKIWEVYNAVGNTLKPITVNYIFGARFDIWRIFLIARFQQGFGISETKNIEVWGNSYPFKTQSKYLHLTFGYKFYSFKRKKG